MRSKQLGKSMRLWDLAAAIIFASSLGACAMLGRSGTKEPLTASQTVPAAAGTVEAREEKNGNTGVNVKVEHLAQPTAIQNGMNSYVVWAKDRESGQVANLGSLKVDKNLDGSLKTVTPFKKFDLFITPERDAIATSPSGERLLWARVESR